MSKKWWFLGLSLWVGVSFLFPQPQPSPNPTIGVPIRFVTTNPTAGTSCGSARFIVENRSTGDQFSCVNNLWQLSPAVTPSYVPTANFQGTPGKFQCGTGSTTSGNLTKYDATGCIVDAGVTPGSGGGSSLALIEQHTATSSSELDFTSCISATYDDYMIRFNNIVPASNSVTFNMQVSTNGGSSYDTTSGHYRWTAYGFVTAGSGAVGNNSDTSINLGPQGVLTTASYSFCGVYNLFSPASAIFKNVTGAPVYSSQAGGSNTFEGYTVVGAYIQTTAVNAFRFLFSSGNITSGTIRCYGVAKT